MAINHGMTGYQKHRCRCDVCRQAQADYKKTYRAANAKKLSEQQRQYRQANLEKLRKRDRDRYAANPGILKRKQELRAACPEKMREYGKNYYYANKEIFQEHYRQAYLSNPEIFRFRAKAWRDAHKDKVAERSRLYLSKRRREDPVFRFLSNLRRRINKAVKYETKSSHTMELIGCSSDELRLHLEKQFKPGMTWGNYGQGGWHIDHIRPCSSFDMTDPTQQKACFNWINLQPLWAKENLTKSDKVNLVAV